MPLKLMSVVRQMCQRNMSSQSGKFRKAYFSEVQKWQSKGFYPVHVGKTEINNDLITGGNFIFDPQIAKQKLQTSWSIIHAGGAFGWVPWKYKLYPHLSNLKIKPDETIFPELCAQLDDHYGNCAIIVNPEDSEVSKYSLYPTSPVEFSPLICCPKVAESYGHQMLQTPPEYQAHLNPLNIAWSTVKWFIHNNREQYTERCIYRKDWIEVTHIEELVKAAISGMTECKWKDAVAKELETCN